MRISSYNIGLTGLDAGHADVGTLSATIKDSASMLHDSSDKHPLLLNKAANGTIKIGLLQWLL